MQGCLYFRAALVQSLPLSTMVDWSCWMANNWVPSISSLDHTLLVFLGAILSSITMCSQVFHFLVAFIRELKSSFPLLVHCGWWPKRGGWFHCVPHLFHCVLPWCPKEAWAVVLRQPQVWDQCPGVCLVVPESDFRHSQDCAAFWAKSAQRHVYRRIMCTKAHLNSSSYAQFDFFFLTLDIFK